MKANKSLLIKLENNIAEITLNRPEIRNAFDDVMLAELSEALNLLKANGKVRALVLTGAGSAFCAGANLSWMQRMVDYSYNENILDAEALANCLSLLDAFPHPTLARVNGAVMGGGMGLVAACDIAVAVQEAMFGFPEVMVGLAPATISPYVLQKIGVRAARRYFISGERFDAVTAHRIGLIHEIAPAEQLDDIVQQLLVQICQGGPQAQTACKELIYKCVDLPLEPLKLFTAELIASLRVSDEGQEGLRAALAKRKPKWLEGSCSEKS